MLLLAACCLLCAGCATRQPLYVYLAYQDPTASQSAYYLRKALVVAPDHATAMDIVGRTVTDFHPSLSGPLYVSLLGVCEEPRQPGLLGGPIWLETTSNVPSPPNGDDSNLDEVRENLSVGPRADTRRGGVYGTVD